MSPIRNTSRLTPKLQNPDSVLKTSNTLWRIVSLNNFLKGNPNRNLILKNLQDLWATVITSKEYAGEPKSAIMEIMDILSSTFDPILDKSLTGKINDFYKGELIRANDGIDIHKYARRFLKDAQSIPCEPVKKSSRGMNGPTLLVSYVRPDKAGNSKLHNFVLKWADVTEVNCTRYYDHISQFLNTSGDNPAFEVPQLAALDFENNIYEATDRSQTILTDEMSTELNEKFQQILGAVLPNFKRDEEVEDARILLLDRVNAPNLMDFVKMKYSFLKLEQRKELFVQIGRLAMLDTVTGNDDRFLLINFDGDSNSFEFDKMESNLGNALVESREGMNSFNFYSIDNVVGWPLIDPEGERKTSYNQFIQELLEKPDHITTMASAIVSSLNVATEIKIEQSDMTSSNPAIADLMQAAKQLIPFREDLTTFGADEIAKGLRDMESRLQSFSLESASASGLKEYLYPDLLSALSERLKIFESSRASS